jgi:MoaA/NifB/PqqE/SkfB family radical SAM enzyme
MLKFLLILTKMKELKIETKIQYSSEKDQFSTFLLNHPLSVCFKITNRCNYNCPHCLAESSIKEEAGMNLQEVLKVLDEIASAQIPRVDITGGEPFLRKDILEILQYANSLDLKIVITSNGSCITSKHIDILKATNTYVQISLDGPQEINDHLRAKSSYENSLRAIHLLTKNNIPVRINCTVQRYNYEYTDFMINLAQDLKVDSLYFILVSAQGRAKKLQQKICLTQEQEINLRKKVSNYNTEGKSNVLIKLLDYKLFETGCILIDQFGNFISQKWDMNNTRIIGNVLKNDLKKMWQKPGAFDHALHLMQYLQHPSLIK